MAQRVVEHDTNTSSVLLPAFLRRNHPLSASHETRHTYTHTQNIPEVLKSHSNTHTIASYKTVYRTAEE